MEETKCGPKTVSSLKKSAPILEALFYYPIGKNYGQITATHKRTRAHKPQYSAISKNMDYGPDFSISDNTRNKKASKTAVFKALSIGRVGRI